MLLLISAPTVKITLFLFRELMSAKLSLPLVLCLRSDRYDAFHFCFWVYLFGKPYCPFVSVLLLSLEFFEKLGLSLSFALIGCAHNIVNRNGPTTSSSYVLKGSHQVNS